MSSVVVIAAAEVEFNADQYAPWERHAQQRQRQSVADVYNILGDSIFWRAFRMTYDSFWRLHAILLPHITEQTTNSRRY